MTVCIFATLYKRAQKKPDQDTSIPDRAKNYGRFNRVAGETLFTREYSEHLANIGLVEDGFLASGR